MKIKTLLLVVCCSLFAFSNLLMAEETAVIDSNSSNISAENTSKIQILQNIVKDNEMTIREASKKYDKTKEELGNTKLKLKEIEDIVAKMNEDIKSLEERSMEIKHVMEDLEELKGEVKKIQDSQAKSEEKLDKTLESFSEISDTLDSKINKMQSWDDIIDILKKEINNNEREIARLKKNIGELKNQMGDDDNILNVISKWPYLGITSLVVSLAALIAAFAVVK